MKRLMLGFALVLMLLSVVIHAQAFDNGYPVPPNDGGVIIATGGYIGDHAPPIGGLVQILKQIPIGTPISIPGVSYLLGGNGGQGGILGHYLPPLPPFPLIPFKEEALMWVVVISESD